MRSSARCCQRLFCVFALCLAVVACDGALSEPPSAPSDAAESSADAQQTREAAEHMVFQEFTGSWDPVTQQLTFDALPYEDWDSVRGFSPDGVRQASQPAYSYCTQRPGNQLLIRSDADSISFDAGDCGAQTGLDLTAFPYSSLGQFCAAVTIENFRSGTVADVYAELVEVSPSAGYDGYRSPYGTGASPLDVTPGFNSPSTAMAACELRRSRGR